MEGRKDAPHVCFRTVFCSDSVPADVREFRTSGGLAGPARGSGARDFDSADCKGCGQICHRGTGTSTVFPGRNCSNGGVRGTPVKNRGIPV